MNTADYRRRMCGSLKDAEWFDPVNTESKALRDYCNDAAIADAVTFLNQNVNGVVIFDSTNVTHERRANLFKMVLFSKLAIDAHAINLIYLMLF